MAENFEKKVLIGIEVKAKEALKEYAGLKIKVDELKEAQSELKQQMSEVDTSTDEGKQKLVNLRQEYEFIGQQVKAYNKEAQNYQKEIQSNVRYQAEQEGSLQQLKAELSLSTAAFNKLSEAERNSAKGQTLQKEIQETTEKLKEEEKALGNHRREVGNYAIAGQSLRSEMKTLIERLTQMKLAGDDNSETFKNMTERLAEIKDAMSDVSQGATQLASDTSGLDAGLQSLQALTASFGAYQSIVASTMDVSDEYLQVMKNMQVAMTALSALQTIQQISQKQGILYQKSENILKLVGINQTRMSAAALAAENVMKGQGTIATKAVAAAQWLWNKALLANPVILIVAAIALLVFGITKLTSLFSSSAAAQREAEKAGKAYEEQQRKTAQAVEITNNAEKNAIDKRKNASREEILELQKNGASAKEITQARAKAEQDMRDIQINASKEREVQINKEAITLKEQYNAETKYLNTLKAKSKNWEEQKKKVDELRLSLIGLIQEQKNEAQNQIELSLASDEADQQAAADKKKKYQDNATKMFDLQRKLQEEQNKLTESGAKRDFLSQQKWNEEMFLQKQKHEQDKLSMQLHFGQITRTEYDAQNKILATGQKTFYAQQSTDLQAYYKQQREQLFSLIGKDVTAQINEINRQYDDALKNLKTDIPEPERKTGQNEEDYQRELSDYKDFMFNQAAYTEELEKERGKKIEEIRLGDMEKLLSEFDSKQQKMYAADLAEFSDNEAEKNRVERKMLAERQANLDDMLAGGKISQEAYDTQTAANNAESRALETQKIQIDLNRRLAANEGNTVAQYQAKKDALQKELKLYAGNADKQLEIQRELAENEKEMLLERIENFEEWAGRTMEIGNAFNDLLKANEDADLQHYQEQNEEKKSNLQARLDAGLISQEQYDKGVAQADAELDRQQKEIARRQAIREKLLKVFDIGINTAAAIMKNTAQLGLMPAIPVNIATGILGAIQLATVLATPLPKASRGKLIKGLSHAAGGTIVEAEGGEAIINKRSTAMFAPLLSAINEVGGGIPFAAPYSDGGFASRTVTAAGGLSKRDIESAMEKAVSKVKVYLTVDDYRRAERNYTDINEIMNN
jgi:Sec-independent protein translocase protein TatA